MPDSPSIAVKCGRCDLNLSAPPVLGRITSNGDALALVPASNRQHVRRGRYPGSGDVLRDDPGPALVPAERRDRGYVLTCRRCKARPAISPHAARHAADVAHQHGWPWLLLDHLGRFTGPHGERVPQYRPRPIETIGGAR